MAFVANPMGIAEMLDAFPAFDAKNLADINTEFSEFGGVLLGKDFYFTTSRNTTRKKYHWDDQPFLDVYTAEVVGETIKNAQILEGDVNTKYHEGTVAVSSDGKRIYFDRNDYLDGKYVKDENGEKHEVRLRWSIAKQAIIDAILEAERERGSKKTAGSTEWGSYAKRNQGFSIVRSDRELILRGRMLPKEHIWRFVGMEMQFTPALDKVFGVLNNKQDAVNINLLSKTDDADVERDETKSRKPC